MPDQITSLPSDAGRWLLPVARSAIASTLDSDPGPAGVVPEPRPR